MVIHKKIAFSIVSLACGLVMWQAMKNTCPPKEQHLQTVTDVVKREVDRIFEERIQFPEESKQLAEYLSTTLIPKTVARLTAQRIDFTSYGIFSLGKIVQADGEKTPISLGLFGKVFTAVSDKDANDYLNGFFSERDIEKIIQTLKTENYGKQDIETDDGQREI